MTNSEKLASVSQLIRIPNSKDNFGLTRTEFDHFVGQVQAGDESLFIKVFNLQFKSSVHYVQNKFSISRQVAYDTCMDTMIEFRAKLKAGKISYGNMRYLFTKMAVHRYIDDLRKKQKIRNAVEVFIGKDSEMSLTDKEFLIMLRKSVDKLDETQHHMIKEIFFSGKDTEQILEDNGITYATYRKRKERSLKKLKSIFLKQIKISQL